MSKMCKKCLQYLSHEAFYDHIKYKDKLRPICKSCYIDNQKIYQKNNPEINKKAKKRWLKNNPIHYRQYSRSYSKIKYDTDINFKIAHLLRCRLKSAIKHNFKTGSAVKDLGCTIGEFKLYFESLFQSGMTWDNHSLSGWHVDHIRPLASFDLTDKDQLLQACHYTNLQPLWALDNIKKSSSYKK